jgi:hypothetical protein
MLAKSSSSFRLEPQSIAVLLALSCTCGFLVGCDVNPTEPREAPLANGRWTGNGACLSVTDEGCNLAVGCGHGQFPKPTIRADGTFDVDGTYRIEAGPVSINPAPPAHFSGSVNGSTLILNVAPTFESLPPASYSMKSSAAGSCPIPCV